MQSEPEAQSQDTGASSVGSSRFISPRNGDMLLSNFELHLQLDLTAVQAKKLKLSLRSHSDPGVEMPLPDIETSGDTTVKRIVQLPEDIQAGYYDLLARVDGAEEPVATTSVRKMPYGATRSKAALCYTAGLGMRSEILTETKLRTVPTDSIRDATKPAMTAEIESDTHDRESSAPRGNDAFFYKPEAGSTLERNFTVYFVDPTALDQEASLHLQTESDEACGQPGILLLNIQMDGNRIRQRVDLPAGINPGEYHLTVRRAGALRAMLQVKVAVA